MRLENIGRIAFPEHLASLLDDVLREVPAVTVPMHTHLDLVSPGLDLQYRNATHCLYQTHHKSPQGPGGITTPVFIKLSAHMSVTRDTPGYDVIYVQLQMSHQMLGRCKISD